MVESCIYPSTLKFGDNLETSYLWFWTFDLPSVVVSIFKKRIWHEKDRGLTMAMGVV